MSDLQSKKFRKSPAVTAMPVAAKAYSGAVIHWSSSGLSQVMNTKVGVQNPKWKEKIASSVDATTPYTRVIFPLKGFTTKPALMRWVNKVQAWNPIRLVPQASTLDGFYGQHLCNITLGLDGNTSHPEIDSAAKLAFLSKIKDAQAQFNAPVFIGELRETIRMLRHPLRGFAKSTHRYRAKCYRLKRELAHAQTRVRRSRTPASIRRELLVEHANRFQNSLEKAFLQWTYGVAPLIDDVVALSRLPALMGEEQEVMRLSVTIPKQFGIRRYSSVTTLNSAVFIRGIDVASTDAEYKCQYRGALRVKANAPYGVDRLREITMLNFREFVPTAYELLPFSFIADYFSTLGSVVNGVFTCTEDLVYCVNTKKVVTTNVGIFVPLSGTQYPQSWPWIPAVAQAKGMRLNRVKADLSVNLRDLRFTMPSLDQGIKTAVLSVSLLRGALGDR